MTVVSVSVQVSAHDVARELRRRLPGVGLVKLHKLLYYIQGWHLALYGTPVFKEPIEAWANGPAVGDLWRAEKHGPCPSQHMELQPTHFATLSYVVERYGNLTGKALIKLTHAEDPWRNCSEEDSDSWLTPSPEITHEALLHWFEADDELRAYREGVRKHRARADVYSFEPLATSTEIDELRERILLGERIVHERRRR